MGVRRFQDLRVWKTGHEAVLEAYRLIDVLPIGERFALATQMRKAAVSITGNIAEGFGRKQQRDKSKFYNYSQASLDELRSHIRIAKDRKYITDTTRLDQLLDLTAGGLKNLIRANDRGLHP